MNRPLHPLVAALWSIAIPGFGQLYNRKTIKAVIFIFLELYINQHSHLNLAIYYSWLFDIPQTQQVIDYQWLLFYPCIYVYAVYDAYHDCCLLTGRPIPLYAPIPFFITCFVGTIGVVWSSGESSILWLDRIGPIFFGGLMLTLGLGFGTWVIYYFSPNSKSSG